MPVIFSYCPTPSNRIAAEDDRTRQDFDLGGAGISDGRRVDDGASALAMPSYNSLRVVNSGVRDVRHRVRHQS